MFADQVGNRVQETSGAETS